MDNSIMSTMGVLILLLKLMIEDIKRKFSQFRTVPYFIFMSLTVFAELWWIFFSKNVISGLHHVSVCFVGHCVHKFYWRIKFFDVNYLVHIFLAVNYLHRFYLSSTNKIGSNEWAFLMPSVALYCRKKVRYKNDPAVSFCQFKTGSDLSLKS